MFRQATLTVLALVLLACGARAEQLPRHFDTGNSVREVFRVDALTALKKTMSLTRAKTSLISADEMELLVDSKSGRSSEWNMAVAALLIVGVKDEEDFKFYETRLDRIEAEARKATAGAKTPVQKARLLLKYLHKGPMHAGYVTKQSDLGELLDKGTFNCVSSAVLFNLIGTRLGLKVQAVEIPNHVFSMMQVGDKTVDVEPTNANGIRDSAKRAERIQKHIHDDNNNLEDIYGEDLYRNTGNVGLVAMMYAKQATDYAEEEQYGKAVVVSLKSLCMDPQSGREVRKLQHNYSRWFKQAYEKHNYRLALAIGRQYQQILRDPAPANAMVRKAQTRLAKSDRRGRSTRA